MKLPICNICAHSHLLCAQCEKKLDTEQVTELDIRVSRRLAFLSRAIVSLYSLELFKTFDLGDKIVFIVSEDHVGTLIGKKGYRVNQLTEAMGKKVVVIGYNRDMRRVLERMIFPIRVKNIAEKFTDETKTSVIELEREPSSDKKLIESALSELYNSKYLIKTV